MSTFRRDDVEERPSINPLFLMRKALSFFSFSKQEVDELRFELVPQEAPQTQRYGRFAEVQIGRSSWRSALKSLADKVFSHAM